MKVPVRTCACVYVYYQCGCVRLCVRVRVFVCAVRVHVRVRGRGALTVLSGFVLFKTVPVFYRSGRAGTNMYAYMHFHRKACTPERDLIIGVLKGCILQCANRSL